MDDTKLIKCFRHSLPDFLAASKSTERHQQDTVFYQSAPVQSLFANMAVNLSPTQTVTNDTIETITHYFKEKELSFIWVVNQDDDQHIVQQLSDRGFTLFTDIECLHYHATKPVEVNTDFEIVPFTSQDKDKLIDLASHAFEGLPLDGIRFFTKEVYFNPDCDAEGFFAYAKDRDAPVAYGTIMYDPNEPIAALSGAATLPEYRNQGIYNALLCHRINRALENNKPHIVIEAFANTSAPRCKNFGFREVFKQQYYKL